MAERLPRQYSEGLCPPPTLDEALRSFGLSEQLDDRSLAPGLTYRDLISTVLRTPFDETSTYGDLLANQDLRYAGKFGYERKLMALELGPDADPILHNLSTFYHTLNTIRLEAARGDLLLDPYQRTVTLTAAALHDGHEGVTDDVIRGQKDDAFRVYEAAASWHMLFNALHPLVPKHFIYNVWEVITHRTDNLGHAFVEVGHTLTQHYAGLGAGDVCFWLIEQDAWDISPFGIVENPQERFKMLASMAVEVTRATTEELDEYADRFWTARQAISSNSARIRRIRDELSPLLAA